MISVYTDTNVLRYFGLAFSEVSLAADLQVKLLVPPLALMELLSQLGTGQAEEAFAAIQAFPRILNAKATGVLPWTQDIFRAYLFNLPMSHDTVTPALNTAVNNVLRASRAKDLNVEGVEFRAMLDDAKKEGAIDFANLVDAWRLEGGLSEEQNLNIFARSIARRAGAEEATADANLVASRLEAYYTLEKARIQAATKYKNYNIGKRSNDLFDSELLVYLAEPTLHFLTSDGGFRRVLKCSQADRINIVEPAKLRNAASATEVLRGIITTVSAA